MIIKNEYKYKTDPIEFREEMQHMNVASPMCRWGNKAIKGEPAVPTKIVSQNNQLTHILLSAILG